MECKQCQYYHAKKFGDQIGKIGDCYGMPPQIVILMQAAVGVVPSAAQSSRFAKPQVEQGIEQRPTTVRPVVNESDPVCSVFSPTVKQ